MPEAERLTARVRMYRQGLGDCHLVTLLRGATPVFRMLIDCGVYQTVSGGADRMRAIVADVIAETGGRVDVLAVTHEHWDHVSGFNQARTLLAAHGEPAAGKLAVDQVWMGWTEDPSDGLARTIVADRGAGVRRVAAAMGAAAGLAPGGALETGLAGILDFFGGAARTSADAMAAAKSMAETPRYCRPDDEPVEVVPGARLYVLGPPRDPKAIYKLLDAEETYNLAANGRADLALFSAAARADPAMPDAIDEGQPFDWTARRPAPFLANGATAGRYLAADDDADADAFLRARYSGPDAEGRDQSWRRIDADWLDGSRDLALKLDNATNNTSLVLALELEEQGKVLLFVADAQVGSWLSWMDLEWKVRDRTVAAKDLLARTAFLKVGHHGSHNATLRAKGLEAMSPDLVAFVPTDEDMARKVGWGRMPLPALVDALNERTGGRTVRADRDYAPEDSASAKAFAGKLRTTELYYEIDIG